MASANPAEAATVTGVFLNSIPISDPNTNNYF